MVTKKKTIAQQRKEAVQRLLKKLAAQFPEMKCGACDHRLRRNLKPWGTKKRGTAVSVRCYYCQSEYVVFANGSSWARNIRKGGYPHKENHG